VKENIRKHPKPGIKRTMNSAKKFEESTVTSRTTTDMKTYRDRLCQVTQEFSRTKLGTIQNDSSHKF